MEAKVKGDEYNNEYYIEVSWNGWITFGEFLHGVFDALWEHTRRGMPCHTGVKVKCKKNPLEDEYDYGKNQYRSYSIEIVPKGRETHDKNFITTSGECWQQELARIGIRTCEYVNEGRYKREFTILGVNWNECGYIFCLPPNPKATPKMPKPGSISIKQFDL